MGTRSSDITVRVVGPEDDEALWRLRRRAGAGRALVEAAIDTARELGAEQLELAVSADNAPAIGLYQRLGFRPWGVQPRAVRVDGRDLDEIWMALTLDASGGHDDRAAR